ncbi:protein Spindly isoform X2 [Cimex lectularius]|uniref:Uncharacterized protein n=1 Tax=Cimex lectularius TaxID=79782 RepID=A0A8I6SAH4_CIMLE|nr:protein Spindly isoform X2 [Cimex lectularius]
MGPDKTPSFRHLEEAQAELDRLKALEEELKQDLYETKKAKKVEDILILELQDEIEFLEKELRRKQAQTDFQDGRKNENKEIQALKDEVACLQTQLDEEVELEKTLIDGYTKKIALLKLKREEIFNIDELKNDIEKTKIENDKLKVELVSREEKIIVLVEMKEELKNLKGQIEEKTSEINQIKSHYEENKIELSTILQSLQDLRSSNLSLSSELASLKAGPVGDIHRGNSLFAEVEDYTSIMERKRTILENKYNKLKKLIQQQNSIITDLKIKNSNLQPKICLGRVSVEGAISKHKDEINALEVSITELDRRPYTPDLVFEGREENLKWMQTFIDIESRKALLADEQFRAVSSELYDLSCTVFCLEAESSTLFLTRLFGSRV